jgi:predicted Zn-dependent protease
MNNLRTFKQKLSLVFRLWDNEDYDAALSKVEDLLKEWPGNARLHVLWASLVQLQEAPEHALDEARAALQRAVDAGPAERALVRADHRVVGFGRQTGAAAFTVGPHLEHGARSYHKLTRPCS